MIHELDWGILLVMVFSLLLGLWRGLIYELASLSAWVVAFFGAQWLSPWVSQVLPMENTGETARYAVAFVVVFIAAVVLSHLVASLVKKSVAAIGLGWIDHTLGAGFGVLRGVLLLLAATFVVMMTPLRDSEWWQGAPRAEVLEDGVQRLKPLLPKVLSDHLSEE